MGTLYLRGEIWWLGFVDAAGKWHYSSTKSRDQKEARKTLADIEEAITKGVIIATGPQTFESYATVACAERGARRDDDKVWGADSELGRLKQHVFPEIGSKRLVDVRPRDIRALVATLKSKQSKKTGEHLAARTIRTVYGIVSTLFDGAVADELLDASPCVLKSGDLPVIADKNPEWRDEAEFSRDEVELIISSEHIPWNRRVWWALGFLTGMRAGEITALRWRHLDVTETPMPMLKVVGSYNVVHKRVKSTKTNRPRRVPVHPVLAAILAEWKLSGWAELNGRAPTRDDLVLTNERGQFLSDINTKKTRPRDLKKLGLRVRRFHDARSTFITLGCLDGADEAQLERVTHNAKGSTFNSYRRSSWLAMCAAVGCLRIKRLGTELLSLQRSLQPGGTAMEDQKNTGPEAVRSEGLEPSSNTSAAKRATAKADASDDDEEPRKGSKAADCRNVGRIPDLPARLQRLVAKYSAGGGR